MSLVECSPFLILVLNVIFYVDLTLLSMYLSKSCDDADFDLVSYLDHLQRAPWTKFHIDAR